MRVRRGDVFYANLSPVIGSEQGGVRPVLVLQNNVGNHYSPTIIVAAITAQVSKPKMPTHVSVRSSHSRIAKNSVVLLEQIRTIDKARLSDRVTHLNHFLMRRIDIALKKSLGLMSLHRRHHRYIPRKRIRFY